jgi:hypothetical protein
VTSRSFCAGSRSRRFCISACALAIVGIWGYIITQLLETNAPGGNAAPQMKPALPETSSVLSSPTLSPLFAQGEMPDSSISKDPFWPSEFPRLNSAGIGRDSSSICAQLADIIFLGTLRRREQLLGLVTNEDDVSSLVCRGDSLRGGIVEKISVDGITIRIGAVTCSVERP